MLARNLIVLNGTRPAQRLQKGGGVSKRCYFFANDSVFNTNSLRGIFPQVSTPFKAANDGGRIAWNNLEKNLVLLEESHSFPGIVHFNNKHPIIVKKYKSCYCRLCSEWIFWRRTTPEFY